MSDESLINASIEVKELIYSGGKGKHIFSWGVLGQYPLDPQLFHYLRFEMVFKEKLEYIPRLTVEGPISPLLLHNLLTNNFLSTTLFLITFFISLV